MWEACMHFIRRHCQDLVACCLNAWVRILLESLTCFNCQCGCLNEVIASSMHLLHLQIHHSTLVERSAALQELQSRAAELQEQLASYHNLPTSVLGASMMLKQARERLQAAQERLESGLADL